MLRIADRIERRSSQHDAVEESVPVQGGCLVARSGIRFPTLSFQADCEATSSLRSIRDLDKDLLAFPLARVGALRYEHRSQQLAILLDPDGSGEFELWISQHGSALTRAASGPIHDAQWLGEKKIIFTREKSGAVPQLFSITPGHSEESIILEQTAGPGDSSFNSATLLLEPQVGDVLIIHDVTSSARWYLSSPQGHPAPLRSKSGKIREACSTGTSTVLLTQNGVEIQHSDGKSSNLHISALNQITRLLCRSDGEILLVRRENYEEWIEIVNLISQQSCVIRLPLGRISPIALTSFLSVTPFFGASKKIPLSEFKEGQFVSKATRRAVEASDGQKIPMIILPGEPDKPVLLRTYGAYGEYLAPALGPVETELSERGFSIAFAALRGGGENGTEWQRAGQGLGKIQAATDLVQAARSLSNGKTRKIFLLARSAGALAAREAIQQAPDLFAGAVLDAPLLNAPDIDLASESSVEALEWGNAPTRLTINQLLDAKNISCETLPPMLLIGSEKDSRTPLEPMLQFQERCPQKISLQLSNRISHDGENSRGDEFYRDALALAFFSR